MKKLLVDSNVIFTATGQIGEAWAVVILEEISKNNISGVMDVLSLQEILDRHDFTDEQYSGKKIYESCRSIFNKPLALSVKDFDLAYELSQIHPTETPRNLMHAAIAIRNNISDIFCCDGPDFNNFVELNQIELALLIKSLKLKKNYTYERQSIS